MGLSAPRIDHLVANYNLVATRPMMMLEWNDRFIQNSWQSRSPILFRNAVTKLGFDDDFLSM
ncbi:hypothetical protein M427DRAFT_55475 [Gonapodya prolifera JEL478]|uniref:Uncharacterized protein n=1 Tax=Gonapodya prolifera (strain JEL478) TaxID=1344416 RepID=A0A139AI82_GONPJ|nr:hypothetical protein M427DRAFT_55475 [Gonapodya prolifera JEL478]|eukprot:KXS16526.1 hypothetical protein M427DRAFT_55475 [Gonapodya prolifera JEL478]